MKKSLLWLTVVMGIQVNVFASDSSFSDIPYFNWKALRLADAVKEVRGDGSRTIAVFTEPECGYCRQYEKTLEKIDNVTIYRFLMPLDARNTRRSESVWCAGRTNDERLNALRLVMRDRAAQLQDTSCSNPVSENIRFGKKFDIYLTPTTIGSDGRLVQGYLPLANLERWLSGKGAFAP